MVPVCGPSETVRGELLAPCQAHSGHSVHVVLVPEPSLQPPEPPPSLWDAWPLPGHGRGEDRRQREKPQMGRSLGLSPGPAPQ